MSALRTLTLVAWVALVSFALPVSGLSAFAEAEGDCDCSSRHEDGDDEDHCPPFCGSCDDCAGCFHMHALVTTPLVAPTFRGLETPRPSCPLPVATPPEAPAREPLHVPRAHA
jgi:hypothetical protein